MINKQKMLLEKSIQETKIFFHKTSQNLKSFLFAGYRKVQKVGRNSNPKFTEANNLCVGFSGQCETALDEVHTGKDHDMVSSRLRKNRDFEHNESLKNITQQINGKITNEERRKEKNKKAKGQEIAKGELSSKKLAKKMKELEMMDVNDVDHVLDVEEVLHYYSRLKSPVYVDIVDKFFVDMHNEYVVPQPTLSASNSMRRSSSMRSNGSMRRLGPVKL